MKLLLVLLMCATSAFAGRIARWANNYDHPFTAQCENHQSFSIITSAHHNYYEDRLWDFTCKDTFSSAASCFWSGHVNDFDQAFDFICPFGSVLSGASSYHDNYTEDRRWKFYCCLGNTQVKQKCHWSGYMNEFDEYLKWVTPSGQYLVGISSYHDNYREDRRWRFYTCQKE
ncbi:hemagglutinin/amebocyte aggregation factor-like [Dendropsophus ebraccatus]|uniref:hemagglutinin/amebocyte aggregation factor-like n=1 Tax=Dendropsophus ebraccatus TaxID=150705 RepID=UPI0038318EFB